MIETLLGGLLGGAFRLARKFHRPSTAPEFSAGKMDKRPGRG